MNTLVSQLFTGGRVALILATISSSVVSQTSFCDWDAVHITELTQALSKAECRQSEFIEGLPDLNGRTLDSVDLTFTPGTKTFNRQTRSIVDVRQLVVSDAEWVRAEFAGVVASTVPHDSCDDISVGSIGYLVEGGALIATFDVHYQRNACTTSTCFRGWGDWHGVPYPIYESCTAKTAVPGASATLAVRTVMTPSLTMTQTGEADVQINIVPTTGVKEGPSELLKNIVGALTLGIGSKAIQDQFEHAVGDFKATLIPRSKSVALLKLPEARKQPVDVTFVPEQPYFFMSAGRLKFAISRLTTVQPSIACSLKQKAIEAHKFFQSCVNPQREYVVQNNDSLWKIAQNLYGEGQYYHAIETRNDLTNMQADQLRTGQSLVVTPFYELAGNDQILIAYGDSLWTIAQRRLGNPLLYRKLQKDNPREITDPNRLVTLVPIKAKIEKEH